MQLLDDLNKKRGVIIIIIATWLTHLDLCSLFRFIASWNRLRFLFILLHHKNALHIFWIWLKPLISSQVIIFRQETEEGPGKRCFSAFLIFLFQGLYRNLHNIQNTSSNISLHVSGHSHKYYLSHICCLFGLMQLVNLFDVTALWLVGSYKKLDSKT